MGCSAADRADRIGRLVMGTNYDAFLHRFEPLPWLTVRRVQQKLKNCAINVRLFVSHTVYTYELDCYQKINLKEVKENLKSSFSSMLLLSSPVLYLIYTLHSGRV